MAALGRHRSERTFSIIFSLFRFIFLFFPLCPLLSLSVSIRTLVRWGYTQKIGTIKMETYAIPDRFPATSRLGSSNHYWVSSVCMSVVDCGNDRRQIATTSVARVCRSGTLPKVDTREETTVDRPELRIRVLMLLIDFSLYGNLRKSTKIKAIR